MEVLLLFRYKKANISGDIVSKNVSYYSQFSKGGVLHHAELRGKHQGRSEVIGSKGKMRARDFIVVCLEKARPGRLKRIRTG